MSDTTQGVRTLCGHGAGERQYMVARPQLPRRKILILRDFGGRGRTRTGTPVSQKQILSLLCLPFHHAAGASVSSTASARTRRVYPLALIVLSARFREHPKSVRRERRVTRLLFERAAPDGFPVLPGDVGHAAVALVELIGNLEHRQHQPALGRPGDMTAADLAPREFAGLDLEAGSGTLLVHELALEHVGLLDLHMLVVGQNGSRRKAHQRGDESGLPVE